MGINQRCGKWILLMEGIVSRLLKEMRVLEKQGKACAFES
jgi:hypothetical protein